MQIGKFSKEYAWTHHARNKMRQYGLSEQRVRRIIHSPSRIEEGIAEATIAFMQNVKSPKKPYELWTMVQDKGRKRTVISAWRYPGTTKPGAPLPSEIMEEIRGGLRF